MNTINRADLKPARFQIVPEAAVIVLALAATWISVKAALPGPRVAGPTAVCPVSASSVARLPRVRIAESHSIDVVQAGSAAFQVSGRTVPFQVPRGTLVRIEGWTADRAAGRPSAAVFAIVGGKPILARMGLPRADVATALGDAAYANAGFELDVPTARLPLGRVDIVLEGVGASQTGSYDLGGPLQMMVTR